MPEIHDHYDGSAHCVQCAGWCKLTGSDLALTKIVRAIFEQEQYCKNPPRPIFGQLERALKDAGVNIYYHRDRAESNAYAMQEKPNA